MGTSWAERKVPHPKKLSRPSLSGLFSSIDATDVPSGSIRNNPMFDEDKAGEWILCAALYILTRSVIKSVTFLIA